MPHILVHHLENSRSQRVLWLLEELGLPYELVRYPRDPATMRAPRELRAIHPLGKSPIVVVDGVVLAESGAVLDTLVEDHGPGLRPEPGSEALRRYRFWLHYAEGSLSPALLAWVLARAVERAPVPFFVKPLTRRIASGMNERYTWPELELHFSFVDAHLGAHPWFAGDTFSAADIQMSFGLESAATRRILRGERPAIEAWLARIHARPAYVRAVERGGPYAFALGLAWNGRLLAAFARIHRRFLGRDREVASLVAPRLRTNPAQDPPFQAAPETCDRKPGLDGVRYLRRTKRSCIRLEADGVAVRTTLRAHFWLAGC